MEKEKLVKALENYFEDCKFRKRLNNKTIKAYKIDLNQFFEIVNNLDDEVKEINEYIHFLNKKYSKHKTVKRKLASVKAFYFYLEYEEIIEYSHDDVDHGKGYMINKIYGAYDETLA